MKKKTIQHLLQLACLALMTSPSGAATLWVDDDACPGPGTGSSNNPFCSIQDAIDAASPGDVIRIHVGHYFETLALNKAITLSGTAIEDPQIVANTVIDGAGVGGVALIDLSAATTLIRGLTIANGNTGGGALRTNSGGSQHHVVHRCNFVNNSNQGAVQTYGGLFEFSLCRFIGNTSPLGGAVLLVDSDAIFSNCVFSGNTTTHSDGAAVYVGALNGPYTVDMINCTLRGNVPTVGSHAIDGEGPATINLTNCLVWANGDAPLSNDVSATYSMVHHGFPGIGNLDENPDFVDPSGADNIHGTLDDDFRLKWYSPCIDAGDTNAMPDSIDADGRTRAVDDLMMPDTGIGPIPRVDIGAFERQYDSNFPIDVIQSSDLQAVIDAAPEGAELILAAGVHDGPINLLGKALTLRSTMPNSPGVVAQTIISGGSSGTVITCDSGEDADTLIHGLTIQQGLAAIGGGMQNVNSSPTVRNCVFTSNTATVNGGGMSNSAGASPTIIGCTFSNNNAVNGGGVHNLVNCNPSFVNCLFTDNQSSDRGGAMLNNDSTVVITNCTLTENTAVGTSAAIHNLVASTVVMRNTIVWNNSPASFVQAGGSTPDTAYSNIAGGAGGLAIIDADPLFFHTPSGDFRLGAFSPCIDAGDNDANLETLDGLNKARFHDDTLTADTGSGVDPMIDMGAYERQIDSIDCPSDIDGNGNVDVDDLVRVILGWGTDGSENNSDIDGSGTVDVDDLVAVILAWGSC